MAYIGTDSQVIGLLTAGGAAPQPRPEMFGVPTSPRVSMPLNFCFVTLVLKAYWFTGVEHTVFLLIWICTYRVSQN